MAERSDPAAVEAMDARIAAIADWRGKTLAQMRALIHEALPDVVETMKWKKPSNPAGVPVWERAGGGILCTGDAFSDKVEITFGHGAMRADPTGIFNPSLNGNAMRAIDLAEDEAVDPTAFKALVRAAAADQAAKRQKSQA